MVVHDVNKDYKTNRINGSAIHINFLLKTTTSCTCFYKRRIFGLNLSMCIFLGIVKLIFIINHSQNSRCKTILVILNTRTSTKIESVTMYCRTIKKGCQQFLLKSSALLFQLFRLHFTRKMSVCKLSFCMS